MTLRTRIRQVIRKNVARPDLSRGIGFLVVGVFKAVIGVTARNRSIKWGQNIPRKPVRPSFKALLFYMWRVDSTGQAMNPKVIRSLGLGLDEKAIEAIRKWKFTPGLKDSKPVNVATRIEVNLRLL